MHDEPEDVYISDDSSTIDASTVYRVQCVFCSGTGVHPGTMKSLTHSLCPVCGGKGILELTSSRNHYHHCHTCDGTGRKPGTEVPETCTDCLGRGIVKLH